MTIAGSDSGGGAGVEADLKTFSALGVYGTCVVTAVTAQNTLGVYGIHPIPPDFVRRQIEAVMEDVGVDVAKTGMLYSGEVVRVVSEAIDRYGLRVVVDPVLRAGSGDPLMRVEDVEVLRECMVPRATVLTPNRYEAEVLSGVEIRGLRDAEEAARELARLGAEAVVLKGGHLEGEVVRDILYHDGRFRSFEKPRFDLEPHGGGCVFSAAIAGYLALGEDIPGAVEKAE
ncbi:bifunctional hydroxymethylpyrimidine kinase/phosphomethylpyrimidine kinase, partial [Candidatus Bathyarchaeota archaeon]